MERTSRFGLLRSSPGFGLLFLATAGSSFGTYLAAITLTVAVFDRTESGVWVAALLIADFLPIVLIGLLVGPFVDRLSRRKLMIVSDLVRFGVFAALPFVDSPEAIVGLAGVAGVATGFFRPAAIAGLPNLVPDEALADANAFIQTVETLAWMIGPIVGGLMLTKWSSSVPYTVNAVTFLVSAVLVFCIAEQKLRSQESLTRGHWRDIADGIRLTLTSAPLRTVLVVWSIALFGSAAVNVAEVVFAKETLDAGNVGFGALVAASGFGLAIGTFLAAPVLGKIGLRRLYAFALLLMGVGWGGAALMTTIAAAVPLVVVGAIGNGMAIICNLLLVQRGAPDRYRGRALATIMSANYLVLGIAMASAGVATDAFGARAVWIASGCVYVFSSLLALAVTRWLSVAGREESDVMKAYGEAAASALAVESEPRFEPEFMPGPEPEPMPEPVFEIDLELELEPPPAPPPPPPRAPEPVPARPGSAKAGLERIATLLEEIEARRQREAARRGEASA